MIILAALGLLAVGTVLLAGVAACGAVMILLWLIRSAERAL